MEKKLKSWQGWLLSEAQWLLFLFWDYAFVH